MYGELRETSGAEPVPYIEDDFDLNCEKGQ